MWTIHRPQNSRKKVKKELDPRPQEHTSSSMSTTQGGLAHVKEEGRVPVPNGVRELGVFTQKRVESLGYTKGELRNQSLGNEQTVPVVSSLSPLSTSLFGPSATIVSVIASSTVLRTRGRYTVRDPCPHLFSGVRKAVPLVFHQHSRPSVTGGSQRLRPLEKG